MQGKQWTLTAKRKAIVIDMLMKQHTLGSICTHFSIAPKTLQKELKKNGIKWKRYREAGILNIRQMLIEDMIQIDDDYKRCDMALKFLSKYDKDAKDKESDVTVKFKKDDTQEITQEILEEINNG